MTFTGAVVAYVGFLLLVGRSSDYSCDEGAYVNGDAEGFLGA